MVELVAMIPSWVAMMVTESQLKIAPAPPPQKPEPMRSTAQHWLTRKSDGSRSTPVNGA